MRQLSARLILMYLDIQIIHSFLHFQLFLSICFVHPSCYQDAPPSTSISASSRASEARSLDLSLMSPLARDLADNLIHRRTERARNSLVTALMRVQDEVKMLMFKYIQIGVEARGVSVLATKNIIDAVKVNTVVTKRVLILKYLILEHLDLCEL